jgi:archaellum biogenesis ATPase FlaH
MQNSKTHSLPLPCRFDDEGLTYLDSRLINATVATEMRISAIGGFVHFPFLQDGEIFAWKCRSITDKKFQFVAYVDEEKKNGTKDGSKLPFFNMIHPQDKQYLIITEGEFDCLVLKQLGAKNVVSLPSGASCVDRVFKQYFKFLQQFELIFIAFDSDKAGDDAASKALQYIPFEKYRRLKFPLDEDGIPYKDANDWLLACPLIDKQDLDYCMLQAKKIESPSITHLSELDDSAFDAIDVGLSTGFKSLDHVLGGLRKEELTLITSETGSGKTTFAMNLVVNLVNQSASVWINSFEMKDRSIRRKIAGIVLKKEIDTQKINDCDVKKFKEWEQKHKIYINSHDNYMYIDKLKKEVEFACLGYKVDYIVFDHLDFLYDVQDKNAFAAVSKVMQELHILCSRYKIGIILIAHPKQIQGVVREITFNDLKGGSCIRQMSENIIILTRKDLINSEESGKTTVSVVKNRELGKIGRFDLKYNYKSCIYSDCETKIEFMPYMPYKDD